MKQKRDQEGGGSRRSTKRPKDRIAELIRSFERMRAQLGPTGEGMSAQRTDLGQVDEGDGRVYAPMAAADVQNQRVLFNPASPDAANPRFEAPGPTRDSMARYQRAVVPHEMGHLIQPHMAGNRTRADLYQDTALGYRGRPWLTKSPQGRSENRIQGQERDQWGMPVEGDPRGMHTSPREQYANDAGYALGHGFGKEQVRGWKTATPANAHGNKKTITRLRKLGLVPRAVR